MLPDGKNQFDHGSGVVLLPCQKKMQSTWRQCAANSMLQGKTSSHGSGSSSVP